MNHVCLDASAALAFVLPDEPLHAQAVALFKTLSQNGITFYAPAMFPSECDSVIRLRVWKGTLTTSQAQTARAILDALPLLVEYDAADCSRAFQIALDYDQPRVYDASYAAHAQSRGLELLTTDAPFFEAVNGSKKPKTQPPLGFVKLLS